MCGRYAITTAPEAMRRLFGYREEPDFPPRYNIAPTQPVPIVRLVDGMRSFALMRWGLLPSWVEEPKGFPLVSTPLVTIKCQLFPLVDQHGIGLADCNILRHIPQ